VAVHNNERGAIAGLQKSAEAAANHIQIVGVGDVRDVPSIAAKRAPTFFGKCQRRAALDRDPVAV